MHLAGLSLHHFAIDSPALATAYDVNPHTELSSLARWRSSNIDYTDFAPVGKCEIKRYVVANISPNGKGKGKGEGPNGGKGEENNPSHNTASEQAPPNSYSIDASEASNPQKQPVKKRNPFRPVVKLGAPSVFTDGI